MDSLSGDSRICFIVCISPALSAATETLSTLQVIGLNYEKLILGLPKIVC